MSYKIPDLNNLTKNELEQIKKVVERQIEFENELEQSIGGLKKTMNYLIRARKSTETLTNTDYEETTNTNMLQIGNKLSTKNTSTSALLLNNNKKVLMNGGKSFSISANSLTSFKSNSNQIRNCYLCNETTISNSSFNFSFNILKLMKQTNNNVNDNLIQCTDCLNFFCQRCGNLTSPDFLCVSTIKINTSANLSKWRCKICIINRELAKKSGCWSREQNYENSKESSKSLIEIINELEKLKNGENLDKQNVSLNEIKRLKIKKFGLVAAAASKFNSNLFLKRQEDNIENESAFKPIQDQDELNHNKNISLDEWRQKKRLNKDKSLIDEEESSSVSKKNFKQFSLSKPDVTLLTQDLSEFIEQPESDENLTNLAKVILIEHKKSLQACKTITQDSSISYNQSTESRRDSFSSRQDSSISVLSANEGEKQGGREKSFGKYSLDNEKKFSRNSQEWHKRRKDLMIRSKKWSYAFDEVNRDDSSNLVTTDESFASNSLIETNESYNNSPINEEEHENNLKGECLKTEVKCCSFSEEKDRNLTRKLSRKLPELPKTSLNNSQNLQLIKVEPVAAVKIESEENENNCQLTTSNTSSSSQMEQSTTEKPKATFIFQSKKQRKKSKITKSMRSNTDMNEQENNQLTKNNFSRSIDSVDSINKTKNKNDLSKIATKSVDFVKLMEKNNGLIFINSILTQRSIDYPCIVRKAPKLSDIVRKRLLFQKVSRGATLLGESFSNSIEKDHVPKTPRKIIIRQDNSIEISLSRPPKLRKQTFSEDITNSNYAQPLNNSNLEPSGMKQNASMLSVSSTTDRRKTIETCENIFIQSEESTKLRARTPPSNPHRILLYKDKSDKTIRTNGLGMILMGGYECEDGSLGCFVTFVIKGGPADLNNIELGDQIMEFNGHSLIDSTYEEVRTYLNNSGDYVQLVVHHNSIRYKIGQTSSPLEISRHFETVPRLCQSSVRKRRNLPPLPTMNQEIQYQKSKDPDYIVAETIHVPLGSNLLKPILINHGRLLMQLWNNCELFKLAITINQVNSLPPRSADEQWFTFVSGRVIFDDQDTKTFVTKAILNPSGVWNETFVFDYVDSIEDATLEICIHDTQNPDDTRPLRENFIGMIILPLSEANLEDEPRWYELRDKPTRKTSTASVTFKSSSNDEDSSNENKKRTFNFISSRLSRKSALSHKRSLKQSSDNSNESSPSPSMSTGSSKKVTVRRLSRAFAKLLSFRRNSESAIKKNIIQFESEEECTNLQDDQTLSVNKINSRNSQRRHTEVLSSNTLLPPSIISRKTSASSSRKTSFNDIEEDIDSYFSSETKCPSTPGQGQVTPKCDLNKDDIVAGDIKLGFLMSKGQLEITVFEARNLVKLTGANRDTYVKTYLRTGTHRIQKKKTQVVKNSLEPVYNSKLSYSACNVLGRRIQVVMIWLKAPKLDKNHCIGEAYIQLDQLDLSQQSIGWYKLFKQHVVDSDFYDSA
ncbi:unnamed protein product [Brachionus calyciflorus]|uniref:Uncharacterized protein n=1 Tax=Brachionus calyciflorus TaxID=104777 RepID=A0A814DLU5_9BILA|nr:unnamed protein product [Brachionus calyciflorus]